MVRCFRLGSLRDGRIRIRYCINFISQSIQLNGSAMYPIFFSLLLLLLTSILFSLLFCSFLYSCAKKWKNRTEKKFYSVHEHSIFSSSSFSSYTFVDSKCWLYLPRACSVCSLLYTQILILKRAESNRKWVSFFDFVASNKSNAIKKKKQERDREREEVIAIIVLNVSQCESLWFEFWIPTQYPQRI